MTTVTRTDQSLARRVLEMAVELGLLLALATLSLTAAMPTSKTYPTPSNNTLNDTSSNITQNSTENDAFNLYPIEDNASADALPTHWAAFIIDLDELAFSPPNCSQLARESNNSISNQTHLDFRLGLKWLTEHLIDIRVSCPFRLSVALAIASYWLNNIIVIGIINN